MKKNFSRTLAALLAAAMLMCIMPAVFAAPDSSPETIANVTLEGVTPPKIGAATNVAAIHVPAGAHYELDPESKNGPVEWENSRTHATLYGDAHFGAGNSYRLRVQYRSKEGYSFDKNTTQVPPLPGSKIFYTYFGKKDDGSSYLTVIYDYGWLHGGNPGDQPLWKVHATVTEPVFGQKAEDLKPYVTLPEEDAAKVTVRAYWSSGDDKDFDENKLFNEVGGCYHCIISFTAKDGWYFAENVTAVLNEKENNMRTFQTEDRKEVSYTYVFRLPGGKDEWVLRFNANGGEMPVDHISGKKFGEVIDLTPFVPTREGYTFVGWCSDPWLKNVITSVTMSESTTVYAKWVSNTEGIDASEKFTDVPADAWYHEAVNYVFHRGYFGGTGDYTFEPETPMTRAMLVTVLWRYEGSPADSGDIFLDVPENQWYYEAVDWAAKNKIVNGVGGGKFDPDGNVTREQMAAILYRYAEKKGMAVSDRAALSGFPDAGQVSTDWALEPMQWAVAKKLITGSDGLLLPQGNATRAQVATILMRFDKLP